MSDFPGFDALPQPVINAPMAGVAGGELADAVRAAGGLGLVAVGHGASAELIRSQVGFAAAGSGTRADSPTTDAVPAPQSVVPGTWGVGLMAWSLELDGSALEQVLEFAPPVIALAAGDPTAHARRARSAGARVAVQVGTPAEVRAAEENPDIDLVVVRGAEGGGHGLDAVSTLPLLQYAVANCSTPVAAAGGIATAAGVAAVLAAGAVAAWVGTRFIPCAESLSAPGLQRAVAGAGVDSTVYTSIFDQALGTPWPAEYGGRALRNAITDGQVAVDEVPAAVKAARVAGDPQAAPVYAGESVGLFGPDVLGRPAAEVVAELGGFRKLLAAASDRWRA